MTVRYQDQVLDEYQRPVDGATIDVMSQPPPGQPAAFVPLTDDNGLPLANPVTTDAYGNFHFNVADGGYLLVVHFDEEVRYKQPILVGTAILPAIDGNHGDITSSNSGAQWTINPGAVDTDELVDGTVTLAKQAPMATASLVYRKSAGNGPPEVQTLTTLKADLGLSGNNTGDQTIVLTGDVTGSGTGSFPTSIAAGAVTYNQIQQQAGPCIVGRVSVAAGPLSSLTGTQVTALLDNFTSSLKGLVPSSGGGTANFLRADGSWAVPQGSGVTSFNTRTGAVVLTQADVTNALGYSPVINFMGRTGGVTLLSSDVITALGYTPTSAAVFAGGGPGLVPTSPGGTTAFLRADGSWGVPPGTGGGSGSAAWGSISGTLSAQTDLQAALNAKAKLAGGNAISGAQNYSSASISVDLTGGYDFEVGGPVEGWTHLLQSQGWPEVHIRPMAGKNGVLSFTENTVADRWSIGTQAGLSNLYFCPNRNLATPGIVFTATGGINASGAISGTTLGASGGISATGNITTSAGGFIANGSFLVDSAQPFGFSHNRAGQVGYHLYNQGAVTEWGIYQPAHATDDNLHIAALTGGTFTDRLILDTGGNLTLVGGLIVANSSITTTGGGSITATGELVSNEAGGTGVVRFGGPAGSGAHFLFYNGSAFSFSNDPLQLSGPFTSSGTSHLVGLVNADNGVIVGTNTNAGDVYLNGPAGSARGVGFQTAGAYVGDISLMGDNVTLQYSAPTQHKFNISGSAYLTVTANAVGVNGYLTLTVNNAMLQFTDASGSRPYIGCQNDNNFVFVGTDASGATRPWASIMQRSSTSSFGFAVLATGIAPPVNDNSNLIPTTAWVQANKPPPSIQSVASAATVTPAFGNDQVNITAQAAALTLANWSGTAVDAWGVSIRIKDNGTARAITYGTQYRGVGVTLPTTTVAGKVLYLGCIWNAQDAAVDVVSVAQQ